MTGFDNVLGNLDNYLERLNHLGSSAMKRVAEKLVEWTKAEHGYHDRTGDLTASIEALVDASGGGYSVVLMATISYAKFVELAASGQWAFLRPVIERHQAEIQQIIIEEMRH